LSTRKAAAAEEVKNYFPNSSAEEGEKKLFAANFKKDYNFVDTFPTRPDHQYHWHIIMKTAKDTWKCIFV
jgi:hypothetical protein